MRFSPALTLAISVLFAGLAGCETPTNSSSVEGYESTPPAMSRVPSAARSELAGVRAATAKYHDVARAETDGYQDIGLFVPGQGHHYLNMGLVDDTFDPEHPELLLYACRGNKLKLVAVEYAVPEALTDGAPDGFTGDADHWHVEEGVDLWVLHAWTWLGNPNGIFADANPNVPDATC